MLRNIRIMKKKKWCR